MALENVFVVIWFFNQHINGEESFVSLFSVKKSHKLEKDFIMPIMFILEDEDHDGKISPLDYETAVLKEGCLLMEAFGKCLPDRKVWYMYVHHGM